eukprot:12798600-Alexandrium_andersonii.AAC.1
MQIPLGMGGLRAVVAQPGKVEAVVGAVPRVVVVLNGEGVLLAQGHGVRLQVSGGTPDTAKH